MGYSKTYREENNELFRAFLDQTFFHTWRKREEDRKDWEFNFSGMELIVTPHCNLGCKYCYIHRFKNRLYPKDMINHEVICKNAGMMLDWLIENRYTPKLDVFSGELLAQKIGFDILELIYDKYKDQPPENRIKEICIPTNYSFILDDAVTEKVEEILEKFKTLGIPLYLSASLDGKIIEEENRPLLFDTDLMKAKEFVRDDSYYERVFKFNIKHRFSFHPMLYSRTMHQWKDNFLWFQDNFKKHGLPFDSLYLLEVRNADWTEQNMQDLYDFIRFLIRWTFENPCAANKDCFINFITKGRGFNILNSVIGTIGRGVGCSLQSQLYVRLGDLNIVPCHRTMVKGYEYGRFIEENGRIADIEALNVEAAIGITGYDVKTLPMCEVCLIKNFCSGGCIGAQFETTGDLFSPIPTVCKMEHYKTRAIFDGFKEVGVFEDVYNLMNNAKKIDVKNLYMPGGR